MPKRYSPTRSYRYAWALPHVYLPHLITVVAGCVFSLWAISGKSIPL